MFMHSCISAKCEVANSEITFGQSSIFLENASLARIEQSVTLDMLARLKHAYPIHMMGMRRTLYAICSICERAHPEDVPYPLSSSYLVGVYVRGARGLHFELSMYNYSGFSVHLPGLCYRRGALSICFMK